MDKVHNGGSMDLITLANGDTIKHLEKELFIMLMVMFIKVNGKMTNPMASVNINIPMASFTKDNGKMINKTVMVLKYGQMVKNIKANLIWDSNQVKVFLNLMMAPFMKDNSAIMKFTDLVLS